MGQVILGSGPGLSIADNKFKAEHPNRTRLISNWAEFVNRTQPRS